MMFSSTQGPRGTKRALTEVLQQKQPKSEPVPVENPREKRLVLSLYVGIVLLIFLNLCIRKFMKKIHAIKKFEFNIKHFYFKYVYLRKLLYSI